jgi:hypothetical protein
VTLAWFHHDDHASAQMYYDSLHLKHSRSFKHNVLFSIRMVVAHLTGTDLRAQTGANREW